MNDYNLLYEQWIPVLYHNGTVERVGILKALEDADRIRQIAASNPMDRVAILRFLLAILYWCEGNPDSPSNGSLPIEWYSRLNDHREYFDLLGDETRFYQDVSAKRLRAVTDLIQEIPAGNNFWHLRHSTDKKDGLCRACCAMGLLRLPLFSLSGLSGPGEPNLMAGINGPPPIYVLPLGKSLLNTLHANWVKAGSIGEPSWAQSSMSQTADQHVPLLNGMTMLSRRVLLHDPSGYPGTCINCGAGNTPVILTCEYQTAGKQQSDLWDDPHAVYLDSKPRKALRAADLTSSNFRMDRPWPDLITEMVADGKAASMLVVGFASNKAKNIDVWERTIDMSGSTADTALFLIRQWQDEGKRLEKQTGRLARSRHVGAALVAAIRPHVESEVSGSMGLLLADEDGVWEQAATEYAPMMKVVAQSLSPGFTTAAVKRRRHIASVLPDMRQQANSNRKEVKDG